MQVLITGASAGLGAEILEQCIMRHYTVVNLSRHEHKKASINIYVDFSELSYCYDAVYEILDLKNTSLIPFDCVILNAGINDRIGSQWNAENVLRHFHINTLGHFTLIQGLLEHDLLKKDANIIVLGSFAAEFGHPEFVAYSMAKAALESWAKALSKTLSNGRSINILRPGRVATSGNPRRYVEDRNSFKEAIDIWPSIRFLMEQGSTGPNGQIIDLARN